jgi:hypothetical protein
LAVGPVDFLYSETLLGHEVEALIYKFTHAQRTHLATEA